MVNEQIKDIAEVLCKYYGTERCNNCGDQGKCMVRLNAEWIYNAGYRKQSVGEWIQIGLQNPKCSLCRSYNYEKSNFCPNCGAKMKGE